MDEQPISENKIGEIFQKAQHYEAQAYQAFCSKFDQQFPMPKAPNMRLMEAIGWQFIVIMIQSAFAIILAALRTADMFYEAASSSNILVRWGDAIAAVVAVEFGIVVFATIKSEVQNRKTEVEDLKSALKVNVKLLQVGIGVGVFVSVIAGLGVSFKGFGVDVTGFKTVLAVVMGAGASIIAWVSGDILGAMLARFGNARALADLEYRRDLEERETKKHSMWEVAPERSIARSELNEMKEMMKANQFRAPRAEPRAPSTPVALKPQRQQGLRGNNEVRAKVYEYLDRVLQDEGRVAGPSELNRELGVAKGYTGGEKGVIKEWMAERGINIPTSETPVEEPVGEEVASEP